MPLLPRLLLAFVLLIVLALVSWLAWFLGVFWFSLSSSSCPYGLALWTETYLYIWTGILILGALIPPFVLVIAKKWTYTLIALAVCTVVNVGVFLLWFPLTSWLGLCN